MLASLQPNANYAFADMAPGENVVAGRFDDEKSGGEKRAAMAVAELLVRVPPPGENAAHKADKARAVSVTRKDAATDAFNVLVLSRQAEALKVIIKSFMDDPDERRRAADEAFRRVRFSDATERKLEEKRQNERLLENRRVEGRAIAARGQRARSGAA